MHRRAEQALLTMSMAASLASCSTSLDPVSYEQLPAVTLASNAVAFHQRSAVQTSPQTVAVTSSSAIPLSSIAVAVRYAAGQQTGWLATSLDSATSPTNITLRANSAGLVNGAYAATVDVTSPVSDGIVGHVAVTLDVGDQPSLDVPQTYVINQSPNSHTSDFYSIPVNNAGGGTLANVSASVAFPAGEDTTWLVIGGFNPSPIATGGSTYLSLFTLFRTLPRGVYTATITVAAPNAVNSPVKMAVIMTYRY